MSREEAPYIPAEQTLPEITIKALILGALLSAVLSAANAYLGLFAGLTVSASIPAAVISMALLRALKGNILENNIVQTSASAGESVAAGVIFTLPALVILETWKVFDYWETTMLAGFGGMLGVLFTVPLRRALIVEGDLMFPEGVATAEVLKVGGQDGGGAKAGMKSIIMSTLIGGVFKLCESGFALWHGAVDWARYAGGTIVYFGSNLSPALVAVGYIVGLNIAILVFLGGALNWLVAIPIYTLIEGAPEAPNATAAAYGIWSSQTRYIGVGAMVIGGLWALVSLRKSLVEGVRSGLAAYKAMKGGGESIRTERELPLTWVIAILVLAVVPLFFIFVRITGIYWVSAIMAVVMLIAGFLFSAVAGYMAGLVGSSNNPISGVTIATILTSALMLLALLGRDSRVGPAAAILIGTSVCCAAAIAGDNMQDLKAGRILGATPLKQQIMQILGVVSAAVVIAPVLNLLLEAYGIGIPTEAKPNPLQAPQATLMASVAGGVFSGDLPWPMVAIGMVTATAVIILDVILEKKGSSFRTPVLAVAVGIYLPLQLSVPILIGGLIAHFAAKALEGKPDSVRNTSARNGLLFGAGLITGEALVGIFLAVPIVISGEKDVLAIFGGRHDVTWPGMLCLGGILVLLYRIASKARE